MSNQQRHILLVSHASGLCGAERSLLDLVKGMKGWKHTVIVPSEGPLTQELSDNGISYMVVRYHAWTGRENKKIRAMYRTLCNAWQARKLAWKLADQGVDLVYVNTTSTPFGALLAKYMKAPCVWHIREWLETFDFGVEKSLKFVENQSACVVTNSYAMKERLSTVISAQHISVVHNGPISWQPPIVESISEKPLPKPTSVNLCIVGTVYQNKGFEDAIEVLPLLLHQGIDASLNIIGEGNLEYIQVLKKKSEVLGVAERIRWHGFIRQPLNIIKANHICIICSREEAFGRVAVEAMSVGTPVVSTAVGGLVEIIQDKETGLLYSPGDVEGLAHQIVCLVRHAEVYKCVQHKALAYVFEHFTAKQYQEKMLMIFRQVIN